MSMTMVIGVPSSIRDADISAYLRIDKSRASDAVSRSLKRLQRLMDEHNIDSETALAIFRSFETQKSQADDIPTRLSRFVKFVEDIPARSDLVETVKDLGLLSKQELETVANETGNWIPFMRRSEKDKEAAHEQS